MTDEITPIDAVVHAFMFPILYGGFVMFALANVVGLWIATRVERIRAVIDA